MRFRCNMPDCGTWPVGFEFVDHGGECPKCNQNGAPLVDVHLMVLAPKGPIIGYRGIRQYVACQPKRSHLALGPGDFFSATDQVSCVTCPKCKATREFVEIATLAGFLELLPEQSPSVIVDLAAPAPAPVPPRVSRLASMKSG